MKALDLKTLKKFLSLAGRKLRGDWVLIGGTVPPLLGAPPRATFDIDLIQLDRKAPSQLLECMQIAEALSLPVEAINQAGAYFFFKTKEASKQLVPLHTGEHCTIYRPALSSYILLKLERLSAADLEDCLALAKQIRDQVELAECKKLIPYLNRALPEAKHGGRFERLTVLLAAIKEVS